MDPYYFENRTPKGGLERQIYKFTTSEILVNEGDLSSTYRSKTQSIPEFLDEDSFKVTTTHNAQALEADMQLRGGMDTILSRLKDVSDTYFIVDIGHAHLPGVAEMALDNGLDCYFIIPFKINNRFHETLKYWAKSYQEKKDKLQSPKGYATFVDTHRSSIDPPYELSEEQFPSVKKLEELGIKKVIYLGESKVGQFSKVPAVKDLQRVFNRYKNAGFEVKYFGIDPRQGFR